jgi:hypothetical protein
MEGMPNACYRVDMQMKILDHDAEDRLEMKP